MGSPKAWLPFGPERMLQRVSRLASQAAEPIVIVAAPGQSLPELPTAVTIVHDPIEGRGPLQGLATGLSAMPDQVELVYATSTDVPFLMPEWIDWLAEAIGSNAIAIPQVGGYWHPLAAVYRAAEVSPVVTRLLADDRLRPVFLMESLPCRVVTEDELRAIDPELRTLWNLNTLEDYEQALRTAGFSAERSPN